MADYFISGTVTDNSRLFVINQSDWTLELTKDLTPGLYTETVTSGLKLVAARKTDGQIIAYGNVEPTSSGISTSTEQWFETTNMAYWIPLAQEEFPLGDPISDMSLYTFDLG